MRRFDKVDVLEPSEKTTMEILMGSIPRIEKQTGIKFKYTNYIQNLLIEQIVSATSEYKRNKKATAAKTSFMVISALNKSD